MELRMLVNMEARRVPPTWEHPKDERGRFIPLFSHAKFGEDEAAWWREGMDAMVSAPDPANYMPLWPEWVMTHWMMYETTTEGTPVSPACETPEALVDWLVDHNAPISGRHVGSRAEWEAILRDEAVAV